MKEPRWILLETVLAIHQRQIAEHGGLEGLRDNTLLESALNAPKNLYHYEIPKPSLAELAASYAYGITRNHPFRDGNKRVSLVVCELFLEINGKIVSADQTDKYRCYFSLAEGGLSKEQFAQWLESCLSIPVNT